MRLIYTTPLMGNTTADVEAIKDIGYLKNYDADFAFGKSENNFELRMNLDEACLEKGSLVYAENTEIGGIVDSIQIDTTKNVISYKGRTWQGVLASKIIRPDSGADYYIVSGYFFIALLDLITKADLLFWTSISGDLSVIDPINVRYRNLYDILLEILEENGYKMKIIMGRDHVLQITTEPLKDYSQDDTVQFKTKYIAKKNYHPVNHIVCLGSGEMKNRYVIDLFFDEAGNLQDYKMGGNEGAGRDETYYLDNRNQVLFGADEVTAIYDYSGAEEITHYFQQNLSSIPESYWKQIFENFYYFDGSKYVNYERIIEDKYQVLNAQPSDWNGNFSRYFRLVDGEYVPAEYAISSSFTILSTQPSDWYTKYMTYYSDWVNHVEGVEQQSKVLVADAEKDFSSKYSNYYTRYWDGTEYIYTRVSEVTKYYYEKQSKQPDDWTTNYGTYYQRKKSGGYESVPGKKKGNSRVAPNWAMRDYFTRKSKQIPPTYNASTDYYTDKTEIVAPSFAPYTYYQKSDVQTAPTFQANTFYQHIVVNQIPKKPATAFYLVHDHYEDLIKKALKKYQNEIATSEMTIVLDESIEYDVGDVVGVEDALLGLAITQKIVKKIIRINSDTATITYEEGGSLW